MRALTKLDELDAASALGAPNVGVRGAARVLGVPGAPVVGVRGATLDIGMPGAPLGVPGAPLGVPSAPELDPGQCNGPAVPTEKRRITIIASNMVFATSSSNIGGLANSIAGA